ncbi:MAG: HypC/HybG/HupF family hydrogenase formation chaperone [Eubacterium sp.]|nr:HypC/HybG/HupF family hydrogenase formation chaperone [Eubacterium sp.]
MCVAWPGTVIEVKDRRAVVDFSDNRVEARTGLVEVVPGDRVLVHAGCILQKVSESEAQELESLFRDLEESAG